MEEIKCLPKQLTGESGVNVTVGNVISFPVHTHMYYEMTLYEPFAGSITVNYQSIVMDRPAVILVTPADFHRIQAPEGCAARYIKAAFDDELLLPAALSRLKGPLLLRPVADPSLPWQLFEELYARRRDTEEAAVLINALTLHLCRAGEGLSAWPGEKIQDWVMQTVRWVNHHFTESVSLRTAAGLLSISPQYLSSVFSRTMGMTFSAYLSTLRLRKAAELLMESDLSVTEICFACGYRNLSHFIRSFKARYGISPLKYKPRPAKKE